MDSSVPEWAPAEEPSEHGTWEVILKLFRVLKRTFSPTKCYRSSVTAFWDVTPCSVIEIDRRFRKHLSNVDQFLPDYIKQYPVRLRHLHTRRHENLQPRRHTIPLFAGWANRPPHRFLRLPRVPDQHLGIWKY
jgi:hypothetical protein